MKILFLVFLKDRVLISKNKSSPILDFSHINPYLNGIKKIFIDDTPLLILKCNHAVNSDEYNTVELKHAISNFDLNAQCNILRAMHWSVWEENTIFCSKCNSKLLHYQGKAYKICGSCSAECFPNLAPAILTLITKGESILLARSPYFKPNLYSLIAGFIDRGESAEDALRREVMEEVGLEVHNIRYFGSQSWPFPNSFMIAYKVDYLSGEIKLGPEIEDAQWFNISSLPLIPNPRSIARAIIDSVL